MNSRLVPTLVLVGLAALTATAQDFSPEPDDDVIARPRMTGIEPVADGVLRAMSAFLAARDTFSFRADIVEEEMMASGQKIQFGGVSRVVVQRPGRLHARYTGDEHRRRTILNNGECTIYDERRQLFAVTDVPVNLDDAIDYIFDRFGFTVPIADLVYADPYATLVENVDYGFLVGRHAVDDVPCYHLAFQQEAIDWQIWITDGPQPVPRKLVITYKQEPGAPQYGARLSNWEFEPKISDRYFTFVPPDGADQIEFRPSSTPQTEETGQ